LSSELDDASETSSEDEPVRETEKLVQPQPVPAAAPAAVPEVAPEVTPGVNFIKLFSLVADDEALGQCCKTFYLDHLLPFYSIYCNNNVL
jgi:hypothetical protein